MLERAEIKKRYQIFVSSTFTDLRAERQAAVEAILKAGHIPAGMELFVAGDVSQLEVIKKWIGESDIYMLILGTRYGSIEPKSGKSYTQIEYEFALEIGKPFFALIIDEGEMQERLQGGIEEELPTKEKYEKFRTIVTSNICSKFRDAKD